MSPEQRARLKAMRDAETDPIQREAYALAERAGFEWYDTESGARRMAEHAAAELVVLRTALARFECEPCSFDVLNPCFNNRPGDVVGKHWGGGDACPSCHARAAFKAVKAAP